jgi:hypothetical protein
LGELSTVSFAILFGQGHKLGLGTYVQCFPFGGHGTNHTTEPERAGIMDRLDASHLILQPIVNEVSASLCKEVVVGAQIAARLTVAERQCDIFQAREMRASSDGAQRSVMERHCEIPQQQHTCNQKRVERRRTLCFRPQTKSNELPTRKKFNHGSSVAQTRTQRVTIGCPVEFHLEMSCRCSSMARCDKQLHRLGD